MSAFRSLYVPASLVRLATVFFFIEFVRGAVLISYIPKYAVDELYLTVTTIGFAVTVHYIADTAAKLGIGVLLDRLPKQWVLQPSFAVSIIGLIMLQYSVQAWMLIVGAAIFGIGASPIWIIGMSSVSENDRGHQMGVLYMAWLLGLGLGPVLMNFFLDWFGYGISFIVLLALAAAAWAVSWLMPNTRVHTHSAPVKEQFTELKGRLRAMRPLLPGMILQTLGASMLLPILPIFAEDRLQLTNSQYSFFLLTGGAFAVLGLVPLGRLSDKLGKKWFLVLGFACFSFGLYSLTTTETLWICLIWAIVLGLSYAAVLPAWNALLAAFVPPQQKGVGWGIFSTVEGIGVMIGPALGGAMADSFGLQVPFLIAASLFLFIGLFYVWFPFRLFK
ncbi:MFS transporter [Paenibacillus thermotolerans]|uniref:MFS transporter n=1 Tax=Paenibacillus thermotolerans TaxID=3027807 RepID=UPI002368B667|nr:MULTISPECIES: MFS transporter [unclassified Paenibacillus]